jgi:hypothetical protein
VTQFSISEPTLEEAYMQLMSNGSVLNN